MFKYIDFYRTSQHYGHQKVLLSGDWNDLKCERTHTQHTHMHTQQAGNERTNERTGFASTSKQWLSMFDVCAVCLFVVVSSPNQIKSTAVAPSFEQEGFVIQGADSNKRTGFCFVSSVYVDRQLLASLVHIHIQIFKCLDRCIYVFN